ncbi:HEPN domain-containing protein [Acidovorax sp. Leaf78]|uniref:HEPN domain-containing protein n=1 Tax=unclassified Acidovorax TaxID=2684926 RepID=UPI000AFFD275|nr:HEPN domain-containing protein [Acidovorax sp. Leaf78]
MSRSISRAHETFDSAIEDACALLALIDSMYKQDPVAPTAEALKRAGLVMSLTAWETYVEDRVTEAVNMRLKAVSGSPIGNFVSSRLNDELKRFHNPNSEKTRRIFLDYLEVDVTAGWKWLHFEPATARKMLDDLLAKRGEAVHRSKSITAGVPAPHLVKRDDLDKAIRFLKGLVNATDKALAEH